MQVTKNPFSLAVAYLLGFNHNPCPSGFTGCVSLGEKATFMEGTTNKLEVPFNGLNIRGFPTLVNSKPTTIVVLSSRAELMILYEEIIN